MVSGIKEWQQVGGLVLLLAALVSGQTAQQVQQQQSAQQQQALATQLQQEAATEEQNANAAATAANGFDDGTYAGMEQSESDKWIAYWNDNSGKSSLNSLIQLILALVFAVLYKKKIVDKLQKLPGRQERLGNDLWARFGLCACFGDINTCLYVCFCPFPVAAKSYEKAGVCSYWGSCLLLSVTYSCCCIGAVIRTYFTSEWKDYMGIEHHLCTDLCLSCFCAPCEIGRESMATDMELGVKITCPLKLTKVGGMGGGGMGGRPGQNLMGDRPGMGGGYDNRMGGYE